MLADTPQVREDAAGPSRLVIACASFAAIVFAMEKYRVTKRIGVDFTTEDQTIFWWVTQDYMRFRFHEPLFYGSPYSSHLESIIAAPLVALGMSCQVAIPFIASLLAAAPFALLAWFAWRQRLYVASIVVLSAHFLLPVEFGALATQAAQPTGVAVGGIAAALLFSSLREPFKFLLFGLLGSLAICLHPNCIYVVGPAGAYLLVTKYRNRWLWLCAGPPTVAIAIGYYFALHFYTTHPAYLLHVQWPIDFQWKAFNDGLNNLDRHLGDLTPTQFHASGFLMLVVVAAIWLTAITRQWQRAFATAVFVIGVVASLAITKVHNGSESFTFPFSRAFYAYPLGVLWLFVLWAEATPVPTDPRTRYAALIGAGTLVAIGTWRQVHLTDEIKRVLAVPQRVVSAHETPKVLEDCRRLKTIADAHGADLVMHARNRLEAYACGAQWYGKLDNIYPPYDRRTALVLAERDRIRQRILVAEPDGRICKAARKHGLQCDMIEGEPQTALITSPNVSALTVADWLGIEVRHL
jgi:hypothetical protein